MVEFEHTICDICANPKYTILFKREDLNTNLFGEYQVVQCNNCGLIYQNPRPTKDSLISLYPSDYDQYESYVKRGLEYLVHIYGLQKRYKIISQYKNRGVLLDIGCGTGDFIEYVSNISGWKCIGIEPNNFAFSRSKIRKIIFNGDVAQFYKEFPDAQFDVITLWNVIEHLYSPANELGVIYKILRDDGILVITTPNVNSTAARLFGRYWIGYELPRHLYVFSNETIAKLLQKTGYIPKEFTNIYGEHAAFMSSVRFYVRALAQSKYSLNFLFSLPIRILLAPLFFTCKFQTRGSWLTVIAQKTR
jgi:SAM-dependent methyltransferase